MRSVRLALYFVLGLMLGGVTVTAFAATGPSRYGSSVNFNYPNGLNVRHRSPPRYDFDSAPDGWGHMRDINSMSIGGRDVDINGIRKFSPGKLASLGVGLAKSLGPIGIGLTLAELVWDAVNEQWQISQVPAEVVGGMACREAAGTTNGGANYAPECDHAISADLAWFRAGTEPFPVGSGGCNSIKVASWLYTARGYVPGDCPAMAEARPATDGELQDAIYVELVARGMGSDLARRLIDAGYTPTPDEIVADGPATIDGGTTTTTSTDPAGITTTTTTTHYDLSYAPGPGGEIGTGHATVGIIRRTETTKTNPDNSIESHSQTESPPSGGGSTQPEAEPEPPPDVCEQNPDASGCAPLGDPQDDQQVETEQRNIGMLDYATVNGTCPQPLTFSVAGYSHEISYQFICDGAVALRPLVIALGMLGAGLFMFGTLGSRKF